MSPLISGSQSVQIVQSALAASNTTYTSGAVTITGVGGGVTVSSNTGQRVDISVATPINFSAGASNLGNTAGSTGVSGTRMVLVGTNAISLSQSTDANGATVSINMTSQSVQTQGNASVGASNLGNTAGSTGVTGTRIVLVGTNMVSLSQSTAAAGATISFDATQSIQTQSVMRAGVSNLGNTAGSTGVTGTRLVLVGSQNITLSQSTDANGGTISFSGGAGAGAFSAGVSTGGNTQGNTGVSGTRIVFVGTNNITLSQNTDANGATVSISGGAGGGGVNIAASNTTFTSGTVVFSVSDGSRSALRFSSGAQSVILTDDGPDLAWWARGVAMTTNSSMNVTSNQLTVFPLMPGAGNRFDGNMTASVFRLAVSFSQSDTASISAVIASTMNVFVYTRNSDSLSLLNSGSMSFGNTAANANNSSNWNSVRNLEITHTSAWSAAPAFVYGGEYYLGLQFLTNVTTGAAANRFVVINGNIGSIQPRAFGATTNSSNQWKPFMGTISLSASNHIRTTIARTDLAGNTNNVRPPDDVYIVLYESTFLS